MLSLQRELHIELTRISDLQMEERRMNAQYVHDC